MIVLAFFVPKAIRIIIKATETVQKNDNTGLIFRKNIVAENSAPAEEARHILKMPGDFFEEKNAYVSEADYPALYALAKKAAAAALYARLGFTVCGEWGQVQRREE